MTRGRALTQVRQQKAAAFDTGNLDRAAALRNLDRQLLPDKLRLQDILAGGPRSGALSAQYQQLHRELDRLRGLLYRHGIDPDTGTAQSA